MRNSKNIPNWFVALPVRESAELLGELARTAPPEIRLFAPEDMHLTVAFLGAMPEVRVPQVLEVMQKIDFEPFIISLDALIPLPSAKFPSAFAYKLGRGHAQTVAVMENWRDALLQAGGAPPERRPPFPHLTVGRPQRKFGAQGRQAGIHWAADILPIEFETCVDSIALYTWSDDRRQKQFKIVKEYPMG